MRPWPPLLRRLLIIGLVLSLIWVIAAMVGARVLRPQVEALLTQALARPVSVQSIQINLFWLSATLKQVTVFDLQGKTPVLSSARVRIGLSPSMLTNLRGPLELSHVSLKDTVLHLTRTRDGRFNISDLLDKWLAPTPTPTYFSVSNIQIDNGRIDFDDQIQQQQHVLDQMSLALPLFRNFPALRTTPLHPTLSARFNGVALSLDSSVTPYDLSREAVIQLQVKQLPLTRYLPYVNGLKLPIRIQQAQVDADLQTRISLPKNGPPDVTLSGMLNLTQPVITRAVDNAPLISAKSARLVIASYKLFTHVLRMHTIDLDTPQLALARNRAGLWNWALKAPTHTTATATPWRYSVSRLRVLRGQVSWEDALIPGTFRGVFKNISLSADELGTKAQAPVRLSLESARNESLMLIGHFNLDTFATQATIDLRQLDLAALQPYFAEQLHAQLARGTLDLSGQVEIKAAQLTLRNADVKLKQLRLLDTQQEKMALKQLTLQGVAFNSQTRSLSINKASLSQPMLNLNRTHRGWNAAQWLTPTPTNQPPSPPWAIKLTQLSVDDGTLRIQDSTARQPVNIALDHLRGTVSQVTWPARTPLQLDLGFDWQPHGAVSVRGPLQMEPLSGLLALGLRRIDLRPLIPYLPLPTPGRILITQADLSADGKLSLGATPRYQGNALLEDVRVQDAKATQSTLVAWKSLQVNGLDTSLGATPRLSAQSSVLSDFFARLTLNSNGKLNVSELSTSELNSPTPSTRALPDIELDHIVLLRGKINYNDQFIKPNYSASLSDVHGNISRISTYNRQAGQVKINGRFNRSAPFMLEGSINPFVSPRVADLTARVKDIDLPGLTPYSSKYAGYPITRGKLSMHVHYRTKNGILHADNQVLLNQLTFGERVESPDATSLPVRLAVNLLQNDQGEININLPVSGSLDDPQFSISGVLWRVIGNLIEKTVTAPFSFLAKAFGAHTTQLSTLAFVPGRIDLDTKLTTQLDQLATILTHKPGLRLDIQGLSAPASDLAALKQLRLENTIQRRYQALHGDTAGTPDAATYSKLLKAVYDEANFAKPHTLLGFHKTLPDTEMRTLILANLTISDADIDRLATRRAQAAQHYLAEHSHIDESRLFLVTVKTDADSPGVVLTLR